MTRAISETGRADLAAAVIEALTSAADGVWHAHDGRPIICGDVETLTGAVVGLVTDRWHTISGATGTAGWTP